jgi:16S rRNA (guanine527-N7)-methyltransferase
VTAAEFGARLRERASQLELILGDEAVSRLAAYYAVLAKWNSKINLTSLPVGELPPPALDRLFMEPLMAARHFPYGRVSWVDLGSGGGSPALPLKVMRPQAPLTMVESKSRKCAFLREAVRVMALDETVVEDSRFEELPPRMLRKADVITIRAVRLDDVTQRVLLQLLNQRGTLLFFGARRLLESPANFHETARFRLPGDSILGMYAPVPRGT